MSFMRKEDRTTISTPIPAGVSHQAMLGCLHEHERIIKLSPQVESFSLLDGNPQMSARYTVTDRKPIGRTTYELAISNRNDGADTHVTAHPPLGVLQIWSQFRVAEGGATLREDVRIEANRAIVGMVKANIEKTHPEQHEQLLSAAKARGG